MSLCLIRPTAVLLSVVVVAVTVAVIVIVHIGIIYPRHERSYCVGRIICPRISRLKGLKKC